MLLTDTPSSTLQSRIQAEISKLTDSQAMAEVRRYCKRMGMVIVFEGQSPKTILQRLRLEQALNENHKQLING